MLSIVIGAAANIVLDPIFIFVFRMGVAGAAAATVIAQALSAAWVLRFLFSKQSVLPLRFRSFLPDFRVMGRIAALGVSPFIMSATESFVAIVFTNGLQKYGGDLYVGSNTILNSVAQFMFVPAHGFAFGAQPIISYNYGSGDYGRVRRCFAAVTVITFGYSLLFYLLIRLAPAFLTGLFTEDAALRALSADKLPIYLLGMSIFGLQVSVQSAFLGLGQTKASLFIACLRKIILLIPLALLLPLIFGVNGIYAAEPISDGISALTSITLFLIVGRKLLHKADVMETLQRQDYHSGLEDRTDSGEKTES